MTTNTIVRLAALAGRIILENGGEVFRVEETVDKICASFQVENSQTYATLTALVVSATDADGQSHTVVERIRTRGVSLDKVDAVNRLSHSFQRQPPSPADARALLLEIQHRKPHASWLVILCSGIACAAFTLLFGGGIWDPVPAFLAGCLIRLMMVQMARIRLNDFFVNVIGGVISTLGGWLPTVLGLPVNMDAIVSSALMLLVPGLMVTNAVRDITAGDLLSGISRFMEAFFVAIAIACGTALGYMLISIAGGIR